MTETNLTFEQEMALFEKFKTMMLKEEKKKHVYHRRSRGTGSIVKLSGNRKKPFVVNVTIGRDEDTGRQIKKCLGTFKSREDAETALSAYNLQRKGLIPNTLPELKIEEKTKHRLLQKYGKKCGMKILLSYPHHHKLIIKQHLVI